MAGSKHALEPGQMWVGAQETRVILASPPGLVLFERLGSQHVRRAREDYAVYVTYGAAFCSAKAFEQWLRADNATLEGP